MNRQVTGKVEIDGGLFPSGRNNAQLLRAIKIKGYELFTVIAPASKVM